MINVTWLPARIIYFLPTIIQQILKGILRIMLYIALSGAIISHRNHAKKQLNLVSTDNKQRQNIDHFDSGTV